MKICKVFLRIGGIEGLVYAWVPVFMYLSFRMIATDKFRPSRAIPRYSPSSPCRHENDPNGKDCLRVETVYHPNRARAIYDYGMEEFPTLPRLGTAHRLRRPPVTQEQAEMVWMLMGDGVETIQACADAGVGHKQFLDWCRDHARDEMAEARKALAAHLASEVVSEARAAKAIDSGYLNAMKWRCQTLDRETFGEKQSIEHSGKIGRPGPELSDLTDEQVALLAKIGEVGD